MNMVTRESRYPGATYWIYSRQCPDLFKCVCFALFNSLESSQTIEVLLEFTMLSVDNPSVSVFQRSWHFAIQNIYTTLSFLYQCCF